MHGDQRPEGRPDGGDGVAFEQHVDARPGSQLVQTPPAAIELDDGVRKSLTGARAVACSRRALD
jgi:hypothetical protein